MKGLRTLAFNFLSVALPITEASGLTSYLSPDLMIWYIIGVIIANIILRFVTTTPVGKS